MTITPGDRVVLDALPAWVADLPDESQKVFRFCVGRPYTVVEIDTNGLAVLDISADVDKLFGGAMNDIRGEPEYLRRVD